jgi:hypothetical protein
MKPAASFAARLNFIGLHDLISQKIGLFEILFRGELIGDTEQIQEYHQVYPIIN